MRVFAILLLAIPLAAQTDPKALIESGTMLLNSGNAVEAVEVMKRAAAAVGDDKADAATAHFYLGLSYDTLRDAAQSEEEIKRLRDLASDAYSRSIAEEPTGSAMNNLAQIRAGSGDLDGGIELLRKAVALDDKQKSFYEENLGDILLRSGKDAEATAEYLNASSTRYDASLLNAKVTDGLVKWAESSNRSSETTASCARTAREYVAKMYANNAVDATIRTALDLVSRSPRLDAEAGRELMALAAAALSKRSFDAASFKDSDAAKQLAVVGEKSAVAGPGARQLMALYLDSSPPTPTRFEFWRWPDSPSRDIPSPLEGFRLVARTLGYVKQQAGDFAGAESDYRVALQIAEFEMDSRAFLDLATLYYTNHRLNDLEKVVDVFDERLYRGKSRAYARLDWDGVYEYHRTLGSVYTWLGKWTDPQRPYASAIFQLEHAQAAIDELNHRGEERTIDPTLNEYLAKAYYATRQPEKAARAQLDAAQGYLAMKDIASAKEALDPTQTWLLQSAPELRSRYAELVVKAYGLKVEPVMPSDSRLASLVGNWDAKITISSPDLGHMAAGTADVTNSWIYGNLQQTFVPRVMGKAERVVSFFSLDKTSHLTCTYDSPNGTMTLVGDPQGNSWLFRDQGQGTSQRLTLVNGNQYSVEVFGPDEKKVYDIQYTRKKN